MLPLEFVDRLPDPVWHDIPITELEKRIIETRAFNRLRSVRQMSLAELEYPSATHTRYQHSIGAMHAGSLLAETLWDSLPAEARSDGSIQGFRVALLLHDIGHAPFSHLVERALHKHPEHLQVSGNGEKARQLSTIIGDRGYSHEAFSAYVIRHDPELGRILSEAQTSLRLPDPQQIALLVTGEATWPAVAPFNALVSGDIDADKIDYVLRDSLYCGFSVGLDLGQLRNAIAFKRTGGRGNFALTKRGVPFVDALLLARYNLAVRVHMSPRARIAGQMLTEILNRALKGMDEETRAGTIIDFHLRYSTRDFENFLFSSGSDPQQLERIYRGDLLKEVLTIRLPVIHPVARLNLYKLSALEKAVPELEQRLRKRLGDASLIVDISVPNPPELSVAIKDESGYETALFDRHFTAHGIFVDSVMGLSLHVYSATDKLTDAELCCEDKEFETFRRKICSYNESPAEQSGLKALVHYEIARICRRLSEEERTHQGVLERDDFLLAVLYGIAEFVRTELKVRNAWVRGDLAFQAFVRSVQESLPSGMRLRRPFEWTWQSSRGSYSVELFRVLERLSYMGLVDHVHKIVGHEQGFGPRLDRTITGWGQMYVEEMLGGASEAVRRVVIGRQSTVKSEHQQCLELVQSAPLHYDREESTRRANRYTELVGLIRQRGGCPLEF